MPSCNYCPVSKISYTYPGIKKAYCKAQRKEIGPWGSAECNYSLEQAAADYKDAVRGRKDTETKIQDLDVQLEEDREIERGLAQIISLMEERATMEEIKG